LQCPIQSGFARYLDRPDLGEAPFCDRFQAA